jgi:DNA-binding transcriptional LysR family regulator
MQDLNGVKFFTAVVEHNGFSAAARALGQPKSSISRHVDRLEARLGVRLLERSTRRVRLTEVGSDYYARCRAALADLETAEEDAALHRADPVGVVRVACPSGFARQAMAQIVPGFMARYPMIQLQIRVTNQAVDLIKEKVDMALRARVQLQDESLTMRRLGSSRLVFVASPDFLAKRSIGSDPAGLIELPFLSFQEQTGRPTWTLHGPGGALRAVTFNPVLWTSEFDVIIEAACVGAGIALLPEEPVRAAIASARLVRMLPEWHSEDVTVHLVFPTQRGMRPAVRVLVDEIVAHFDAIKTAEACPPSR